MKEKHALATPPSLRVSTTASILALPRATKRLITVSVDTVAIVVALWAALALKFDRLDPAVAHTMTFFVVAVVSALSIFSISGLYRTVIRFAGAKAMTSIVAGVTFSVLVL